MPNQQVEISRACRKALALLILTSSSTSALDSRTDPEFAGAGPWPADLIAPLGQTLSHAEVVYGPFQTGFSAQEDNILSALGCNPASLGRIPGGFDIMTSEAMIANQCKVELPRNGSDGARIALDASEQYTKNHFYQRLNLNNFTGHHSPAIARAIDGRYLYGQWEDAATHTLPELDACGGHWGPTPESGGRLDYHYHVQDRPPYTFGCFGPNPDNSLVTIEQCRALYPAHAGGCGGHTTTVSVKRDGVVSSISYDPWCPCFDATGSNVGTVPLPVFSDTSKAAGPGADYVPFTPKPLRIVELEWELDSNGRRCIRHSKNPSSAPNYIPTGNPIAINPAPTSFPSSQPTNNPTNVPTANPTTQPTRNPTTQPTANPTNQPTTNPTNNPTNQPTRNPTNQPTTNPTNNPTNNPTRQPTQFPTQNPTRTPTRTPTQFPTQNPTRTPTRTPTQTPTQNPTRTPTRTPTQNPTRQPTANPTINPTRAPTTAPTSAPSSAGGDSVTSAQLEQVRALIINQFNLVASFGTECNDRVTPCHMSHAAGQLVRLAFHDAAGSGGAPNGCIDLTVGAHGGLPDAVAGLDIVFSQSRLIAPLLSKADLWIFAANVAIELTSTGPGNPTLILPFRWGRPTASSCNDNNLLPSPAIDWNGQKFFWSKMNYTIEDVVAIMGAHSLGRAVPEETGFSGGWTHTQSSFGNNYYKSIRDFRFTNDNRNNIIWNESTQRLFMLKCDMEIFFQTTTSTTFCSASTGTSGNANCPQNPETAAIIASFIADQSRFYQSFSNAWVKLTEFGLRGILRPVV